MLRKTETLSRLLLTALVASVIGCQADSPNRTSDQIVSPTTPISLQVRLTTNRTSLVADGEATATITATCTRDGLPIADFTAVTITTTLGTFDSPGGGNSVELLTINGRVTATLFPGGVEGVARLTANCLGAIGISSVTIKPAVEVIPPPTASTLSISADTVVVSDEDSSTTIGVTATVLGSNLKPFKKAPVFFSIEPAIGLFSSSGGTVGDVIATNTAGQASDSVTVNGDDLTGIDSFTLTATLTTEGGGTTSAGVAITVIHGPADPVATSVSLSADKSFVTDDGGGDSIGLTATVLDQFGQPFGSGQVTFASTLGTPSPTLDTSDSPVGDALSTLTLSGGQIAAHPTNSFTLSAKVATANGFANAAPVVITIVRPTAALSAEFTNDTTADTIDLLGDPVVQFTDASSGSPTTWAWDLDGDGFTDDANIPNPTHDYTGFLGCSVNVTLTVTRNGGTETDSVSHVLTIDDGGGPCP
jgi:PKD repeat protein